MSLSYFLAKRCTTRAEFGTAETPAAPISGLTLSFTNRFMSLAKSTPQKVAITKDKKPRAKIPSERGVKNVSARVLAPMLKHNTMVAISISEEEAVFARRSVTPLSFSKLPRHNIPIRVIEAGAIKAAMIATMMGNRMRAFSGFWRCFHTNFTFFLCG